MCTALEQLENDAVERRDRELIMKWSAAGYGTSEIANLLGLPEEKVRKVQAGK
ncbi:MAG: hypothetical protein LIO99_11840 [Clostridiales bacterium]|nr:hypothetical protein [Clostridiales bacterium]